ncbi:hypothetical protein QQ045_001802 [Rhodiola kirilowii]
MALVKRSWLSFFPEAGCSHLNTYSSDHMAILVKQSKMERTTGKVFRFERMWLRDDQFKDVVTKCWTAPSSRAFNFEEKLLCLQTHLTERNKKHFGNGQTKIKSLKHELAEVQAQVRTAESVG